MALTSVPFAFTYPRVPWGNGTPALTSLQCNADGEKYAVIFESPVTDTITDIEFATGVTTVGGNIDVRLETVDLTTGNPSGSLQAANTNVTVAVANADDLAWKSGTLTSAASVTKGDKLAVVLDPADGAAIDLNFMSTAIDTSWINNYVDHFTAAWAKTVNSGLVAVKFGTNGYIEVPKMLPFKNLTNQALTTSALHGNIVNCPVPFTATGFWLIGDLDQNTTVRLYDSDGATLLMSGTTDLDLRQNTSGALFYVQGDTTVDISASTDYRVVVGATGSNGGTLVVFDVESNARLGCVSGGTATYYTTAATQSPAGGGSWTNTNTKRAFIGLVGSRVHDGAGGGTTITRTVIVVND